MRANQLLQESLAVGCDVCIYIKRSRVYTLVYIKSAFSRCIVYLAASTPSVSVGPVCSVFPTTGAGKCRQEFQQLKTGRHWFSCHSEFDIVIWLIPLCNAQKAWHHQPSPPSLEVQDGQTWHFGHRLSYSRLSEAL